MTESNRSASSQRWLARQRKDTFAQQARDQGFRSRAAYKLLEIQQRDHILRKGMVVVDLGAAPGGWSQVAASVVGREGKIIALDRLPIKSLNGVDIVEADFETPEGLDALKMALQGRQPNVVLSDMAPNLSGIQAADQARSLGLAESAYHLAEQVLVKGGNFVVKLFQGEEWDNYWSMLKREFGEIHIRKPDASRQASRETYIVAKRFLARQREKDAIT